MRVNVYKIKRYRKRICLCEITYQCRQSTQHEILATSYEKGINLRLNNETVVAIRLRHSPVLPVVGQFVYTPRFQMRPAPVFV